MSRPSCAAVTTSIKQWLKAGEGGFRLQCYLAKSSRALPHQKKASPHSSAVSPYFLALKWTEKFIINARLSAWKHTWQPLLFFLHTCKWQLYTVPIICTLKINIQSKIVKISLVCCAEKQLLTVTAWLLAVQTTQFDRVIICMNYNILFLLSG